MCSTLTVKTLGFIADFGHVSWDTGVVITYRLEYSMFVTADFFDMKVKYFYEVKGIHTSLTPRRQVLLAYLVSYCNGDWR